MPPAFEERLRGVGLGHAQIEPSDARGPSCFERLETSFLAAWLLGGWGMARWPELPLTFASGDLQDSHSRYYAESVGVR